MIGGKLGVQLAIPLHPTLGDAVEKDNWTPARASCLDDVKRNVCTARYAVGLHEVPPAGKYSHVPYHTTSSELPSVATDGSSTFVRKWKLLGTSDRKSPAACGDVLSVRLSRRRIA